MISHHAVIIITRICILNKMIPEMPFPDYFAIAIMLNFKNG